LGLAAVGMAMASGAPHYVPKGPKFSWDTLPVFCEPCAALRQWPSPPHGPHRIAADLLPEPTPAPPQPLFLRHSPRCADVDAWARAPALRGRPSRPFQVRWRCSSLGCGCCGCWSVARTVIFPAAVSRPQPHHPRPTTPNPAPSPTHCSNRSGPYSDPSIAFLASRFPMVTIEKFHGPVKPHGLCGIVV